MFSRFTIIFLILHSLHCLLKNSLFQLNFSQANVWILLFPNLIFISYAFFFIYNVKFIFSFFFFFCETIVLSISPVTSLTVTFLTLISSSSCLICSLIFWSISPLLSHKLFYFLPRNIVFKQICRGNGSIMTGMISELKYSYNDYKYLCFI